MEINNRFPEGIREQNKNTLAVISDNGCQPTSLQYKQECAQLNIDQIFTTWSNPKGNADTERVIRRIKENLMWPMIGIILFNLHMLLINISLITTQIIHINH